MCGLVALEPGGRLEAQRVVEPLDVVFPVLHGTYGEDGTIQGLFELAGIAYVGSGVLGSAAGMDKAIMKTLFQAAGLAVAEWAVVMRADLDRDPAAAVREVGARLGYPCFVKPANLGSSVGVSKAADAASLERGLRE